MNIIFAPHADDEVIGCFSLLYNNEIDTVYYFYDLNEQRKAEAYKCSEVFNFTPVFVTNVEKTKKEIENKDILYLPHRRDNHPSHKYINQLGKQCKGKKKFYSVDMNVPFDVLSNKMKQKKSLSLYDIYPSQRELFNTSEKYYLFESIQETDTITYINVKTNFKGFHKYPDAPEEVKFLKNIHRHIFNINIKIQVFHNDREIEFFMLQNEIDNYIQTRGSDLNYKSCEMLAEEFLSYINSYYPGRNCIVEVQEDNENSSIIEQIYWS